MSSLYPRSAKYRYDLLTDARTTNYGVVRPELIETLYERMYDQRRERGHDERKWPHRIMGGRQVVAARPTVDGVQLRMQPTAAEEPLSRPRRGTGAGAEHPGDGEGHGEILDVDLVIAATGYRRTAHVDMLRDLWPLLPESRGGPAPSGHAPMDRWEVQAKTVSDAGEISVSTRSLEVARDYQVQFSPGTVAPGCGIWLQGCCEGTHGVSQGVFFRLLLLLSLRPAVVTVLADEAAAERHASLGSSHQVWGDCRVDTGRQTARECSGSCIMAGIHLAGLATEKEIITISGICLVSTCPCESPVIASYYLEHTDVPPFTTIVVSMLAGNAYLHMHAIAYARYPYELELQRQNCHQWNPFSCIYCLVPRLPYKHVLE